MSSWRHQWTAPTVSVLPGKPPLHVPRQVCLSCGAQRNPISGGMVFYGYNRECLDRPNVVDRDWSSETERVHEQLQGIRADGGNANPYHAEWVKRA